MTWNAHYFILNDAREPVEVTEDEWRHWRAANDPIRQTICTRNSRVTTLFIGQTDDSTMAGPPQFLHMLEGPALKEQFAYSLTYADAVGRHDRIAEWLRKRAARFER